MEGGTSRWVHLGRLRVRCREYGRVGAPPIVLVHGLGVSGRYFAPVARELARSRRVYVPDLPGVGESDRPARAPGIPELAVSLAAVLDVLGLERVPLVANSLGCQVVLRFAADHPSRVERVVLAGLPLAPGTRTPLRQLGLLALTALEEPLSLWPVVARDYVRAGLSRIFWTGRQALAMRTEELLPLVRAPVLVVRGASDPLTPRAWAEHAARLCPDGRFVEVPGAAHALNWETPRTLAALVEGFLAEERATGTRPPLP